MHSVKFIFILNNLKREIPLIRPILEVEYRFMFLALIKFVI